ncbi:MAG TPA: hypothetical protein VIH72_15915 [Candidatus Acidoferrales bacterium]|jgi:hypothetical protein
MKVMKSFGSLALVTALVGLVSVIPAVGVGQNSAPLMRGVSIETQAKSDLSGKWDLNVTTDGGPIAAKAEFTVASDGTISGTIDSAEYGSSKIASGSVKDASFSFKFDISASGSVIEVTMSGTFDEKSLKGSGSAGDMGFSFTGTRASSSQN